MLQTRSEAYKQLFMGLKGLRGLQQQEVALSPLNELLKLSRKGKP